MKIVQGSWLTLALLLVVVSLKAQATENNQQNALYVKPNRCIALRQGQLCYQKLHFSWDIPDQHQYCLYNATDEKAISCWKAHTKTTLLYNFKSTQDMEFYLVDETTNTVVGKVKINVAWVYKSSKKVSTGWRLF